MRKITLTAAVTLLAAPLAAQTSPQVTTDLTVTMSSQQYRICNDRPARPTWMDEVNPREAYKALTLMRLYELRSREAIKASGAKVICFAPTLAMGTLDKARYLAIGESDRMTLKFTKPLVP